MKFYGAKRRRN